jgi:hypothetical protein
MARRTNKKGCTSIIYVLYRPSLDVSSPTFPASQLISKHTGSNYKYIDVDPPYDQLILVATPTAPPPSSSCIRFFFFSSSSILFWATAASCAVSACKSADSAAARRLLLRLFCHDRKVFQPDISSLRGVANPRWIRWEIR